MEMVRAHVLISGRVQGVFFRDTTRREAQSLQLTGWVKNCFDGRVEAVFEGEKEAVDKMITWCHHGPPHASVQEVELTLENFQDEFDSFNIRGW